MLRLRITVALSVLALAIGLGGTQWLSDRSDMSLPRAAAHTPRRPLPVAVASKPVLVHRHRSRPMARPAPALVQLPPVRRLPAFAADVSQGVIAAPSPELVPLDMPVEHGTPYDKLRGHLDGRVVVHLTVDGQGGVTAAGVVQSSGDAVLDAHALRSVRGWRFALPPDHPAGLSADLPMQFSSRNDPIASAP